MSLPADAGIQFVRVTDAGCTTWSRPGRFTFLDTLVIAPVADSELLHLAHYAPIAILFGKGGPEVVLILHSSLRNSALTNAEGRWNPPYAPIAIRCLPFRNAVSGDEPEFAPDLCDPAGEHFRFVAPDGKPTAEFSQMLELLQRLGRGRIRTGNAAKLLLAADVLVPIQPLAENPELELATVSSEKLHQLSTKRAASLTADMNIAFELAAALVFSQRWLPPNSIVEPAPEIREEVRPPQAAGNYLPDDGMNEPVLMDDSSLFSIDDFLKSLRSDQ